METRNPSINQETPASIDLHTIDDIFVCLENAHKLSALPFPDKCPTVIASRDNELIVGALFDLHPRQ